MEISRTNAQYKRNDGYNLLYEIEWILSVLWIFFVRQIRQIQRYGNQAFSSLLFVFKLQSFLLSRINQIVFRVSETAFTGNKLYCNAIRALGHCMIHVQKNKEKQNGVRVQSSLFKDVFLVIIVEWHVIVFFLLCTSAKKIQHVQFVLLCSSSSLCAHVCKKQEIVAFIFNSAAAGCAKNSCHVSKNLFLRFVIWRRLVNFAFM